MPRTSLGLGAALAATALAPTLQLAVVPLTFVGAASVGFTTTGNSTVQLAAAPSMRGRPSAAPSSIEPAPPSLARPAPGQSEGAAEVSGPSASSR